MKKALTLRHVPFEDLGLIEPILHDREFAIESIDVPVADLELIDPLAPDLLVIMGGPIGVYQTATFPFLVPEIALIESRIAAGKPTLGICLGSQLMARALGARVYPAPAKELGWMPVELAEAGKKSPLAKIPAGTPVFHWHGDTFDIPADATLLASTELCPHQAFSFGANGHALALQFHPEVTAHDLEAWWVGHIAELGATPGTSVSALREETHRWAPVMESPARTMFKDWLTQVGL
ncbi:MAG: glutamine amidotransferase [Alphaproteobacteria bacterium]